MNTHEPIKDVSTLGIPKTLILGLQHLFAMFGATILVPILVNNYFNGEGLSIQVTLFFAGIGTLFFHLCSKFKVPAFLGSSFAFLGGFHTVANLNTGIFKNMTMCEKLPYACGGIVVAGSLYLVLAIIIKLVGINKVMKYLGSISMEMYLAQMVVFRFVEKLGLLYIFGNGYLSFAVACLLTVGGLIAVIELWKLLLKLFSKLFGKKKEAKA